ncbi:MAG: hypothetical protein P5702_20985 [Limnospira sp. PMC 1291.21]|uniref:hypothetical protein n=1 Tax=unclassified Limnospira TaxID=2642885 RepID=UPI0028E14A4B|nr:MULTISPECIES: hypothetical protein [unclassified Limnospira]MDT9180116.1 hypothetical protein [Limnospira sp. PMC 1238.20]MDT9195394.1 hypothetical protein [Limnospira sp. PMC 1245.20]MDT9205623.1 hypothetical protein [Limnospira sp. PMC 1243.20]MDT9210782.1 hypothetical protein [Limnospira sp. PMC 1252.20]MDT9215864.1 hypothetical protein [Limnospira sp. PMC 1256.20]
MKSLFQHNLTRHYNILDISLGKAIACCHQVRSPLGLIAFVRYCWSDSLGYVPKLDLLVY